MSVGVMGDDLAAVVTIVTILCVILGFCIHFGYWIKLLAYDVDAAAADAESTENSSLKTDVSKDTDPDFDQHIFSLMDLIAKGAKSFLGKQMKIQAIFVLVFSICVFVFTGWKGSETYVVSDRQKIYSTNWAFGGWNTLAYVCGTITTVGAGRVGVMITTATNGRVLMKCVHSAPRQVRKPFEMAIHGCLAMAFGILATGLAVLLILIGTFKLYYTSCNVYNDCELQVLYQAVAAFALGIASMTLFGRLGGGIYTKAADVASELCEKLPHGLEKHDPHNPCSIADCVGEHVGLIAGVGSDMLGSVCEGVCAAMVILGSANNTVYFYDGAMRPVVDRWMTMCFPIAIVALCICACFLSLLFIYCGSKEDDPEEEEAIETGLWVEPALKRQLVIATVLMTPIIFLLGAMLLPEKFYVEASLGIKDTSPKTKSLNAASCEGRVWDPVQMKTIHFPVKMTKAEFEGPLCMGALNSTMQSVTWYQLSVCVVAGLWAGLIIGFLSEYFTSARYSPVMEVHAASETGPATNVIYGLALGYNSTILPVLVLGFTLFVGYGLAKLLGVACASIGIISVMPVHLTIDAFGPIADNAHRIARMIRNKKGVHKSHDMVKLKTKALDSAGDVTAAIGKGFAIAAAMMASMGGFCAYCVRSDIKLKDVSILEPNCFFGLIVGAMLPYAFSALTMKSVGEVANDIKKQMETKLLDEIGQSVKSGAWDPVNSNKSPAELEKQNAWYGESIEGATRSALAEIFWPAALCLFAPVVMGVLMGKHTLAGMLVGAVIAGVTVALSASNSGSAWDNAKKKFESDGLRGSAQHDAATQGNTVGDPLKDASGPATNILMKLMPLMALVFGPLFCSIRDGYGLLGCSLSRECSA